MNSHLHKVDLKGTFISEVPFGTVLSVNEFKFEGQPNENVKYVELGLTTAGIGFVGYGGGRVSLVKGVIIGATAENISVVHGHVQIQSGLENNSLSFKIED